MLSPSGSVSGMQSPCPGRGRGSGPAGPQGVAGAQGPTGATGATAHTGYDTQTVNALGSYAVVRVTVTGTAGCNAAA